MSNQTPRHARKSRWLAAVGLCAALWLAGSPALAHVHDSTRSGHPLRIIAYVLHPVGVVLDTVIMKPIHWIGSYEPMSTLFGHEEDE